MLIRGAPLQQIKPFSWCKCCRIYSDSFIYTFKYCWSSISTRVAFLNTVFFTRKHREEFQCVVLPPVEGQRAQTGPASLVWCCAPPHLLWAGIGDGWAEAGWNDDIFPYSHNKNAHRHKARAWRPLPLSQRCCSASKLPQGLLPLSPVHRICVLTRQSSEKYFWR